MSRWHAAPGTRGWTGDLLRATAPILPAGLVAASFLPAAATGAALGLAVLAAIPGTFVARALLGTARDRRWLRAVSAIPCGYLLASAGATAAVALLGPRPGAVLLAIAFTGAGALAAGRLGREGREAPARPPPGREPISTGDLVFIALLSILMLGLLGAPFARIGKETDSGFAYRDYFSGDFLKHVAVTAELAHGEIPPANPFFRGGRLHYYWGFYVLPGLLAGRLGTSAIEPLLIALNLALAGSFVALWTVVVRTRIGASPAWQMAAAAPLLAGSFEGLAVLTDLACKSEPWGAFRGCNVDGYSRWLYGPPEISTLFRLLLYNMQHVVPAAIFLIALLVWEPGRVPSRRTSLVLGVLGALAIGHSGFLGSLFVLWAGLATLLDPAAGGPTIRTRLVRLGLFALAPAAAGLVYTRWLAMLGAGSPLVFGLVAPLRAHPIGFIGLNFGLGILGLAGILARDALASGARHAVPLHRRGRAGRAPALLLGLSLALIGFVQVPDWSSDVAVKVGYTSALALALFLGDLLARIQARTGRRWIGPALMAPLALGALVSLGLEVANASDVANRRFTALVAPLDMAAYDWIRRETPPDAVVQKGPRVDTRESPYSAIPAFAHRRTALGDWMHARIFLLTREDYERRRAWIEGLFRSRDGAWVHAACRAEGIDYLCWGIQEFDDFGPPHALDGRPDLFEPVLDLNDVVLFRVVPA